MPHRMAGPEPRVELQRTERHKQQPGHDVDQRQDGVSQKNVIQAGKPRKRGVCGSYGRPITVHQNRPKRHNPAHNNCRPDDTQKNNRCPQPAPSWLSLPHINQYAWKEPLISRGFLLGLWSIACAYPLWLEQLDPLRRTAQSLRKTRGGIAPFFIRLFPFWIGAPLR